MRFGCILKNSGMLMAIASTDPVPNGCAPTVSNWTFDTLDLRHGRVNHDEPLLIEENAEKQPQLLHVTLKASDPHGGAENGCRHRRRPMPCLP